MTNLDFFDCSDKEAHFIDELKLLGWHCLDFDSLPEYVFAHALSLSLDKFYGGHTPAHVIQNKIRKEFGIEIQLSQRNIDADGSIIRI